MLLRHLACVACLLICPLADAAVPPELLAQLDGCYQEQQYLADPNDAKLEPPASLKKAERVGKNGKAEVYYLTGPKRRHLVFLTPESSEGASNGKSCAAFSVNKVADRASGHFVAGMGPLKAVALNALFSENDEGFPYAVFLQGAAERPLTAALVEHGCGLAFRLRAMKLFPNQESVEVYCEESNAGYGAARFIIHVFDGELMTLHQAYMGFGMPAAPDEKREGDCSLHPGGWIKILRPGLRPVLQIPDMLRENLVQAPSMTQYRQGIANAYEWTFDPVTRRFNKSSAATAVGFDAYRGCRPRRYR
jgi:hypothetical protein